MTPRRIVLVMLWVLLAAGCGGHPASPLMLSGEAGGACQGPAPGIPWSDLQRYPTEFGLDYFKVSGDKPVTVESVTLVGGDGGLRLVEAAFAPGGGVGVFSYRGPTQTHHLPDSFKARLTVPNATLTNTPSTKATSSANPSADKYQLVIAVVPTRDFASARAARITYRSDGKTHALLSQDFILMARAPAECSADRITASPTA